MTLKMRLTTQQASKNNCGETSQFITLMWNSNQTRYDYSIQWFGTSFSWYESMIVCSESADLVRKGFKLNTYKGGR